MLQKSVSVICMIFAPGALVSFARPSARAAGLLYTVTTLLDVTDFSDGECSLREAMVSANGGVITNCGPASNDTDEIEFAVSGTINLTSALPAINGILTIGGGINNMDTLFLTNVTLSGNQATYGGGLKNEGGSAKLSKVAFFGNSVTCTSGGGILNDGLSTYLYPVNVLVANSPAGGNCAFSTAPDTLDSNLSSDNTCNFGAACDNVNVMLNPLANNGGSTQTHLPQYGSPAIDRGTDEDAPNTDQRNVMRPQGSFYDVGSVKVAPCTTKPPQPTLVAPTNNKSITKARVTLKWNTATCAKKYTVIVKDAVNGKTMDKPGGLTPLQYKTDPLPKGKSYKWFVQVCNPDAPKPRCASPKRVFSC